MVESLTTLFKSLKTVKRAFLCSIKEHADEQPNLLIGIEAEGDIDAIIRQAGSVATDTLPGDEPVDICLVAEGEKGISHFMMAHITPFYERRWGVSCATLKPTGLSDSDFLPRPFRKIAGVRVKSRLLPAIAANQSTSPD